MIAPYKSETCYFDVLFYSYGGNELYVADLNFMAATYTEEYVKSLYSWVCITKVISI